MGCLLLAPIGAAATATAPRSSTDLWITAAQRQALGVEIETLAIGPMAAPIATLGTVAYDDVRLVRVYSPVTGIVTGVIAPLGAQVAVGAPLAVLSSADMAGAKADLDRAKASLKTAAEEAARQNTLFAQKASSARDYEAAKDNLRRAQAERARAAQQVALLTGGKTSPTGASFTLRSPLVGEVVARNVGIGAQVRGQYQGGSAAPLFTIADLDRVWLLVDLHESDLGRVYPGAKIWVQEGSPKPVAGQGGAASSDKGPPPLVGTVDWLADVVDPNTHTLQVRCTVDNHARRLRPGMRVVVDIAGSAEHVLSVPADAVLYIGRQPYVFVARSQDRERSMFRLCPIELDDDSPDAGDEEDARVATTSGAADNEGYLAPDIQRRRMVKAGLVAGDLVVAHGALPMLDALARGQAEPLP